MLFRSLIAGFGRTLRHRMLVGFRFIAVWIGVTSLAIPLVGHADRLNPTDYPALSTKQMGHVRHMINMANDLPGDFSLMGQMDPVYHMSFHAYQFQFAFAHYALASAHYHYTPAHRDLYQDASARLIKRMIYKDVWDYWAHVSKYDITGRTEEGGENVWRTEDDEYGWIDPNIKKNIMYSGHLLQMVGLHETLFDDHRYDQPGSLMFRYAPPEYGQDPIEMKYDHDRLTTVIFDQFEEGHFRGIECERNAVYAECNQHPILGLMSYDLAHGTSFSPEVKRNFKKVMVERNYIDPETKTTMYFLKVREDEVIPATYAWADGWNGHAQHVWDKQFIEDIYPHQQRRYIPSMLEGAPGEDMGYTASFDFGWFALLASEVGDNETVQTMTDYADAHFNPTWMDGGLMYPTTADYLWNFMRDEKGLIQNVGPVTGNVLIGFARINPADGLWQIYNKPFDKSHFADPYITDVEYLEASVTQAVYDAEKDALIVTLAPGPVKSEATSFTVRQMDPKKRYTLIKDGKSLGEISASRESPPPGTEWRPDGSLRITTDLGEPHSFVLKATPTNVAAR
ncbi:MAG TPA: hypothetical protein QF924_07250 [Pseudomonadales bacterium]|jgi:hypothetical protein|nr:hypothetical protein [Pseudomonadales bacterium]|tara:strand:- start:8305 stop:10005 length:1701 start_codon:yes stop_codon:yes gene_type:complete